MLVVTFICSVCFVCKSLLQFFSAFFCSDLLFELFAHRHNYLVCVWQCFQAYLAEDGLQPCSWFDVSSNVNTALFKKRKGYIQGLLLCCRTFLKCSCIRWTQHILNFDRQTNSNATALDNYSINFLHKWIKVVLGVRISQQQCLPGRPDTCLSFRNFFKDLQSALAIKLLSLGVTLVSVVHSVCQSVILQAGAE